MTSQPPCAHNPTAWLQPGETNHWHTLPAAYDATQTCQTLCPTTTFLACAENALTAGTLADEHSPRPADGVIMAGIACTGDDRTIHELHTVIREVAPDWEPPANACKGCGRVFVDKTEPATAHTAHAVTKALCITCHRNRRNIVALPKRPNNCLSCDRPMTTRSKPKPDHVRHERGGYCTGCIKQATRKDTAA